MEKDAMKKKLFLIFAFVALVASAMFSACDSNDNKIIHTIRTVVTFSGYRVDYVRVEYLDADVSDVVVKYYVDDVYIKTCPTSAYKYFVYTNGDDYMHLSKAYETGLITHDDLLAIAEAEKPYDSLYDEDITGPVVH